MSRKHELEAMTREHIAAAIEDDLEDGETLMKEVFEQADTQGELKTIYAEMRRIISSLRRSG